MVSACVGRLVLGLVLTTTLELFSSCAASSSYRSTSSDSRGVPTSLELLAGRYDLKGGETRPTVGFQGRGLFPGYPFGVEGGVFFDTGAGGDEEPVKEREVFLGLWMPIDTGTPIHVYIGAGGTGLHGSFPQPVGGDETGNGYAAYVHTGAFVNVWRNVQVGLDVRGVFASSVQVLSGTQSMDYVQVALSLGIGIGGKR